LDRAGILDDALAKGTCVTLMQMQKVDGTILGNYDWNLTKHELLYPFNLSYMPCVLSDSRIGQHTLAQIMLEHTNRYPTTKILFNHDVQTVIQDTNSATVSGKTTSGEDFTYSASYLVGADGGKSTVRKALGVTLDGFTWNETYMATNVFYPFEELGYADANFVLGGEMDWAIVCRTGDKNAAWRCTYGEVPVSQGSDEEVFKRVPQRLAKFLRGAKFEEVKVEQVARYNVHQRCAKSFRLGRTFLAGDAAHLTQPMYLHQLALITVEVMG
jgi:2-polyprenyl-6-methoxyphenol hydroxylase-like FAD-dependent oxidoreductase